MRKRFETLEEPIALTTALKAAAKSHDVILVDCLTLWITNLIGANQDVARAVDELASAMPEIETSRVILVSNEVGWGVHPETPLGRRFRDALGLLNQTVARAADEVVLLVAGCAVVVKPAPQEPTG